MLFFQCVSAVAIAYLCTFRDTKYNFCVIEAIENEDTYRLYNKWTLPHFNSHLADLQFDVGTYINACVMS